MGDCTKCVSPKDYKKSYNSNFLDTVDEIEITREDVKDMPREIYNIFEKTIDDRMMQGRIKLAHETTSTDGKWVTINGNHVLIKD